MVKKKSENTTIAQRCLFFLLIIAPFALAGCGPEFPIRTEKQDRFYRRVDNLVVENKKLKDRVASLEKRSVSKDELARVEKRLEKTIEDELRAVGIDALRKEIEEAGETLSRLDKELKALRAETNATLDSFRQDLGRLQGGIEESDYRRDQLRDELTGELSMLKESLAAIVERLATLEKVSGEAKKEIEDTRASVEALRQERPAVAESLDAVSGDLASLGKNLDELRARIESLDEKTAAIDDKTRSMEEEIRSLDRRLKAAQAVQPEREEVRGPDPGVLYMEGFRLITKDHEYGKGIERLERFISLFPDHDLADNAQYWIGEGYYGMGDYERAILEFDRVIKDYPEGDKVAAAMLKQGFSFEKLGAVKEAKVLLERVIERFPGTGEAQKARKRLEMLE